MTFCAAFVKALSGLSTALASILLRANDNSNAMPILISRAFVGVVDFSIKTTLLITVTEIARTAHRRNIFQLSGIASHNRLAREVFSFLDMRFTYFVLAVW